jgi:hypothetical protein
MDGPPVGKRGSNDRARASLNGSARRSPPAADTPRGRRCRPVAPHCMRNAKAQLSARCGQVQCATRRSSRHRWWQRLSCRLSLSASVAIWRVQHNHSRARAALSRCRRKNAKSLRWHFVGRRNRGPPCVGNRRRYRAAKCSCINGHPHSNIRSARTRTDSGTAMPSAFAARAEEVALPPGPVDRSILFLMYRLGHQIVNQPDRRVGLLGRL